MSKGAHTRGTEGSSSLGRCARFWRDTTQPATVPSVGMVSFSWKQKCFSNLHSGTFCKRARNKLEEDSFMFPSVHGGTRLLPKPQCWDADKSECLWVWATLHACRTLTTPADLNLFPSLEPWVGCLNLFTDAAPAEAAKQELWEPWKSVCHLSLNPLESLPFPSRWTWPEQLNRTLGSSPDIYHPVGKSTELSNPEITWFPRQEWEFWAMVACLETD